MVYDKYGFYIRFLGYLRSSGYQFLGFSGSRILGFLGFWVLGLSSSGEPCCTLKLKLRKMIKKIEKKIIFFNLIFFKVTSHGLGYPRIPEISEFWVRAGQVWPILWSGSSGPEF
mgnify:CR=1 FL=1